MRAIEDMKKIGDDMSDAVWLWLSENEKLHELNDRCEWIIGRINGGFATIDYWARQANIK